MGSGDKIYLDIDYGDSYVQPLLIAALKARLPPELLAFVNEVQSATSPTARCVQWRQYESINFEHLLEHSDTRLANAYVIRKALIRKHYLSTTVSHWLTKHPDSVLKKHVKPSVEFEVDYAEFLDDALVDAFELRESWERNESKDEAEKEWWILKPGMSERGQGIRLFSSEEELTAIFEEWDPPSDDEDDDDDDGRSPNQEGTTDGVAKLKLEDDEKDASNGVVTSQLRHFIAQPYIHPPLLLAWPHPSAGRKFHIRTYVLAIGALRVYVYRPMLALFAGQPYTAPGSNDTDSINDELSAHLTNTCLQTSEREGSVHAFWSLPSHLPDLAGREWKDEVFTQICQATGEVFEAAARTMGIHFQPLPNAFEIFGLDFLVDAQGQSWLLEVNAFPDFAQTGEGLQGVIGGLFEGVVEKAVVPFFGIAREGGGGRVGGFEEMVEVLDIDLGRR
ncbi:TTL-domain-containing protein [Teratosphaeria destructans]|uniref:TTL-domain-containing protein n=1 Tax=Teratosphaeria destructans TaxID=418781 RepID=A0A9W7W4M5_9PEZI|nr:TTL-domain-containing protein [Teratosphaeria destructans]